MKEQRVLQLLGLCRRAGKLTLGDVATRQAIAKGAVDLILVAEDAGRSTRESFLRLGENAKLPCVIFGKREELGQAVGAGPKAVLGIIDQNLGAALGAALAALAGDPEAGHHTGVNQ